MSKFSNFRRKIFCLDNNVPSFSPCRGERIASALREGSGVVCSRGIRPLTHGESLSAQTFQKAPFQRLQSFPEPLERLELLERLEPWTSAQTHSPPRCLEIQSIFVTGSK